MKRSNTEYLALIYLVLNLRNLQSSDWSFGSGLLYLLASLAFITIPAAIGIAILRYRLFDIDIIIRSTLQYSILTGVLGLTYLGGVTVLQGVFTAVSGQESPAARILSTLGLAVLFNPLRRRIQDFIDRLFYRRKYDAEKALAEFAAAARSETNLENLNARLLEVISNMLQPEILSLRQLKTRDMRHRSRA
jgi:hypothetical protein